MEFVISHPKCSYYIFLDTDICFYQKNVINTMLTEIENEKDAYAVLAKLMSGKNENVSYFYPRRKVVWDIDCGFSVYTADGHKKMFNDRLNKHFLGKGMEVPRELPPHCTLIKNTAFFRRVAKYTSFSDVCTFEQGMGSVYDILGLVALIMKINRKSIIHSSCSVKHFGRVTYANSKELARKRQLCQKLIGNIREKTVS